MKTEAMRVVGSSDADLVAQSLGGDREAFARIVERYQTLIASLAYSATGNLSRSEDLTQETFVSAWKQLKDLREPAKLRSWLCSIARFRISKEFRHQQRVPEHAAESLESLDAWVSPEPLPPDQAISDEEKAILWRALQRLPEIYREPLVLFYREQQSIEAVAEDLELSEDAVKQRLSRGRKLLQEQFLSFVAGALKQTVPGKNVTLAVVAALPLMATTASGAAAGSGLTQSGSVAAKTASGFLQASFKSLLSFACWLAPVLPLSGYIGYKMGVDRQHGDQARRAVATFWQIMGGGMLILVLLPPLLLLAWIRAFHVAHDTYIPVARVWFEILVPGLVFGIAPLSLCVWIRQRRKPNHPQAPEQTSLLSRARKSIVPWVALAVTGALFCLACFFLGSVALSQSPDLPQSRYLSTTEVQKLITDSSGGNIDFCLIQHRNGFRRLNGEVRENGSKYWFEAPAESTTLALLEEKGIQYEARVAIRDLRFAVSFVLGLLGNWAMSLFLPAFCLFLVVSGAATLLRQRKRRSVAIPEETDRPDGNAGFSGAASGVLAGESKRRPAAHREHRVDEAFAALAACGMIAVALALGLTTNWKVHYVTSGEIPDMVAQHKNARYDVFEYRDGSRELWISDVRSPEFIAPADQSTLELLTRQGINYQVRLADLDWWYRPRGILAPPRVHPQPSGSGRLGLSPSITAVGIFVLVADAGCLLCWVCRVRRS